ncbi:hypothetical protein QYE76_068524 [Lolium multiflorum]|uniref:Transposase (putative) gypsy type domain-containing protein n=1 Tax=Lolium multiflorum TaxID=4521 RepID=A0AAD8WE17_LOLMU|nr:hypothetical protein QYE76_068524 [Lolium multiflorum]
MGKKKSVSASGATKVSRDWGASTISNREVSKLRTLGLISPSDDDIRLPGAASRPKPPKGFTVMFVAFLFRGLSLPAHEFLRSLLFFYGIQLWQLTPNSILHLSIFITVCEAFLGIDPHWGLWRKIFYVKRHNDNNGPPVVGGVGVVVRKEVDYFNFPMKESVQGWRHKWFYLRDTPMSGRRSNLPPFKDVLVAQPKKSWRNTLSPEESAIADKLFEQVVDLKNAGGLTMCDTEVVSVFLKRRVQPLMSRPHQLWMYNGKNDTSRASTVAQCYPPTPESGVEPEDDDDDSEETEDAQHILEDSDVQEDEAPEDDVLTRSRRCKRINEDLITMDEPSPNRQDNDADETASPPPAAKSSTSFFAMEDDLDLYDDDDDVPLAKRAKLSFEKSASLIYLPQGAADITINRARKLREDSMSDALSLAAESNVQVLGLLQKTKGALSRLFSMIFPKMKQDKTLGEMADAFLVDPSEHVEVLKRRSRLFGAVLTFQLLMGHGLGSELEKLSKALPVDDNNCLINLEPFKQSAVTCANQLLKLVDEAKTRAAPEATPGSSSALP